MFFLLPMRNGQCSHSELSSEEDKSVAVVSRALCPIKLKQDETERLKKRAKLRAKGNRLQVEVKPDIALEINQGKVQLIPQSPTLLPKASPVVLDAHEKVPVNIEEDASVVTVTNGDVVVSWDDIVKGSSKIKMSSSKMLPVCLCSNLVDALCQERRTVNLLVKFQAAWNKCKESAVSEGVSRVFFVLFGSAEDGDITFQFSR
jgi:hypothetical protein